MNAPAGFEPAFVLAAGSAADAVCFVWGGDKIVARTSDPPALPRLADVLQMGIGGAQHYLGQLEGVGCIAIRVAADAPLPAGWEWRGLRTLFLQLPDDWLALAGRAFQIVEWDRSHQFCGRCGAATRDKVGERAKECPACGHIVYPRVSAARFARATKRSPMHAGFRSTRCRSFPVRSASRERSSIRRSPGSRPRHAASHRTSRWRCC